MADYETLKNKQNHLIRKALDGSVFVAPITAIAVTDLTTYTAGPPVVVDLTALPAEYEDVGWISDDGAQFSRDVETSDVTSWGSVEPTRRDITSDTTTLAIACQETKKATIGLYSGADMDAVVPDPDSGEVSIAKPARPSSRSYRVLTLAVDLMDAGEVYVARFLPRAQVTDFDDQSFTSGDDPIMYSVTFTGYMDATLGYSERWLFGGPGWLAALEDMGFEAA